MFWVSFTGQMYKCWHPYTLWSSLTSVLDIYLFSFDFRSSVAFCCVIHCCKALCKLCATYEGHSFVLNIHTHLISSIDAYMWHGSFSLFPIPSPSLLFLWTVTSLPPTSFISTFLPFSTGICQNTVEVDTHSVWGRKSLIYLWIVRAPSLVLSTALVALLLKGAIKAGKLWELIKVLLDSRRGRGENKGRKDRGKGQKSWSSQI